MSLSSVVVNREVEVVVSPQALKVLSHTPFSVDEFVDWALNDRRISFGGNNVANFLEFKYREVND